MGGGFKAASGEPESVEFVVTDSGSSGVLRGEDERNNRGDTRGSRRGGTAYDMHDL